MNPPRVLIAARHAPTGFGGLAQYQRTLARILSDQAGCCVEFLLVSPPAVDAPFAIKGVVFSDHFRHSLWKSWMRLASRPVLHGVLDSWIRRRFSLGLSTVSGGRLDAVHFVGTGWDFFGFAACDLARKSGAAFTVWPAVHPGQWGDDRIDLRLYNLADTVFCQSHVEARHLVQRGLDQAKVTVCGLPPMCPTDGDGARFREARSLGSRPVVLFVGRRAEGKGFHALAASWKRVLARMPEAVLVAAGDGTAGVEALLGEIPARSQVDLGTPSPGEIADAYAACDLFCMPSANESFGIAYVEAWSYGKPVICGPAPAPREWIQHGVTGLHTSQNPGEIAEAILELLRDPERGRVMGAAGREFQQHHLTEEVMLQAHLAAFRIPFRKK